MKKLFLLMSLLVASHSFAGQNNLQVTPGKLVYESITQVGDKYIITLPSLQIGKNFGQFQMGSSWERPASGVCKLFGFADGEITGDLAERAHLVINVAPNGTISRAAYNQTNIFLVRVAVCTAQRSDSELPK